MSFLAIVEHGSINRAAHALNVSQPALTRTLQNFEARMGGKLLTRTSKGVELTAFGEMLAGHARAIQTEVKRTEQTVRSFQDTSTKHLSVGVVMVHPLLPFCEALIACVSADPDIRLHLKFGTGPEMLTLLRSGAVEIVLSYILEKEEGADFVQDVLAHEEISLYCSPSHWLASMTSVGLGDLARARWVLGPDESPLAHAVRSLFELSGTPGPDIAIEVEMTPLRRAIVMRSDLVSLFQAHHVDTEVAEGRLVRVAFDVPQERRSIGTLRLGRHSRASRRFLDALRKSYAELHPDPFISPTE